MLWRIAQRNHAEHAGPDRNVGAGPYTRLILRDVTVVDGTGAPPYGPADIVLERDRIAAIHLVGPPTGPRMQPPDRPQPGVDGRVLELAGHWVLPGLVDSHGHIGWPNHVPNAQYVYDLWLSHGITAVREPGCFINGLDFVLHERIRSAADDIAAPRIWPYVGFGEGRQAPFTSPAEACAWVNEIADRGAAGVKLFGYEPAIYKATLREVTKLGLGSACHHMQTYVARANALDSARWGLGSIEHWYGLPEAILADGRVQAYPLDYNYENEFSRFGAAGALWAQAAEPGSAPWNDLLEELLACGTTLDPTFNVYVGLRDAERVQSSSWHDDYTAPQLWDYWQPGSGSHGAFFDGWGTEQETLWRRNFTIWMAFVKDYYDRGGRVTTGTDPGSIFSLFGFDMPAEMELLREAGLRPLEIVRAATLSGAELLGAADQIGSIEAGKLADLLVVGENPLANLKVLYRGVQHTIKNGIVYDAPALLARVRETVLEERARRAPR